MDDRAVELPPTDDHDVRHVFATATRAIAAQSEHLATVFSSLATIAKAFAWAVPGIVIAVVGYAAATGHLTGVARLVQGYKVTQTAAIDGPFLLPRQSFRDYLKGVEHKTFRTSQSDAAPTGQIASEVGDVLAWQFHVRGYAAASYAVFYDDLGGDRAIHDQLCSFTTQTNDDSYGLCTYWVPPGHGEKAAMRTVTVWLNQQVGRQDGSDSSAYDPIAVKSYVVPSGSAK